MNKLAIYILIALGFSAGIAVAGTPSPTPSPVATPALDSWGIVGLMLLVPVVAAFVYKKKK